MNDLSIKLMEIITQLQGIIKDNTADAVNLGLNTIRISGIGNLIEGILMLILAIAGVFGSIKLTRLIKKELKPNYYLETCRVFVAFETVLFFIVSFCDLFSIWTWVAIFRPKLWLAHQVIENFTQ